MKQYKRSVRIGEQILRNLPEAIAGPLEERFAGLVTFTRVHVTDDLRYCTVYYSYLGKETVRDSVEQFLQHQAGRIRKEVGGPLRIRHIPEFRFQFDPSVEEGLKIEKILNEIKNDRQSQ
jgi:ribosome-binding factor A